MKVRFDGLDVTAMVALLQRTVLGRRVVNIYDGGGGSTRGDNSSNGGDTYVFKLESGGGSTSTGTGGSDTNSSTKKEFLLLESGIRFHLTSHYENASTISSTSGGGGGMPSPFVAKLRKHIRGLRLESIVQLGNTDRVVLFQFGVGNNKHSIILELYSKGNLILVDCEYTILALLRSHIYDNNNATNQLKNQKQQQEQQQQQSVSNATMEGTNNQKLPDKKDKKKTTVAAAAVVQVGQVYPVTYATSISKPVLPQSTTETETTVLQQETRTYQTAVVDGNDSSSSQEPMSQPSSSETEQTSSSLVSILDMKSSKQLKEWITRQVIPPSSETSPADIGSKNQKQQPQNVSLKTVLLKPDSGVSHYGPGLVEHCILSASIPPHKSLKLLLEDEAEEKQGKENDGDDNDHNDGVDKNNKWNRLLVALQQEGRAVMDALQEASRKERPGYILYRLQQQQQQQSSDNQKEDNHESMNDDTNTAATFKIFEEFQPHLLKQHEKKLYDTYPTFSDAVDMFFANLANQKAVLRAAGAELNAAQKLQRIKQDQLDRVKALEKEQLVLYEQAKTVQIHADTVDKALLVINSALDSGMDWDQLEQVVTIEKTQNFNPVAIIIHELDLKHDSMILRLPKILLSTAASDDDDVDKTDDISKPITIDVKVILKETAHANASRLFAKYRSSKEKSQKTIEASAKAFKAAEENAKRQMLEAQQQQKRNKRSNTSGAGGILMTKRPYYWYEKFHWFITSDNYLVVGGKDAQQNEILVKRYLRPGDAYLHADVFGASSCILRAKRRRKKPGNDNIKQRTEVLPLSETALREAGNFTICHSSAWKTKMITSAWWVESHQVSKTAPSGEYLTTGAFMIRGKKNYLPPTTLEMGLAVLFRISDDDPDSIARHKNERRDFAALLMDEEEEDIEAEFKSIVYDSKINDKVITKEEQHALSVDSMLGHDDSDNLKKSSDEENNLHLASNVNGNYNVLTRVDPKNASLVSDSGDESENDHDNVSQKEASKDDDDEKNPETRSDDSDNEEIDDKVENVSQTGDKNQQQKRGHSARDRKLIKKYGSLEEAHRVLKSQNIQGTGNENNNQKKKQNEPSKQELIPQVTSNVEKPKRGKKAKEKKMKKYADQDEEDRKLALLALQGGEQKSKKKKGGSGINKRGKGGGASAASIQQQQEVAAETASLLIKDSVATAAKLPIDVQHVLAECITVHDTGKVSVDSSNDNAVVRWDKLDGNTLEQLLTLQPIEAQLAAAKRLLHLKQSTMVDNLSASLGGIIRTIRKYGHEGTMDKEETKEDEATNRKTNSSKQEDPSNDKTSSEEVLGDVDEEDGAIDDTFEISKLTGKPHPEDLILYAVPVCGPYAALQHYTYRVKLTPGATKRGKAAKQCVDMFLKGDKTKILPGQEKHLDFIKRAPDNDWVQVICAETKISAAGASKLVKANVKSKKTKNNK